MGRHVTITPELTQAIADAVQVGVYPSVASEMNRVSESTYYRWMARGLAADGVEGEPPPEEAPYHGFWEAIKEAAAKAEARNLEIIAQAASQGIEGQWQAAAWWLERTRPHRYSLQTSRLELTGKDGAAISVSFADIDNALKAAVTNELANGKRGDEAD